MRCRSACSTAFRAQPLAGIVLMALVCLWPCPSVAQGALPIQWMYGPISEAQSEAYSPDGTLLAVGGGVYTYNRGRRYPPKVCK